MIIKKRVLTLTVLIFSLFHDLACFVFKGYKWKEYIREGETENERVSARKRREVKRECKKREKGRII